MLKLVKRPKSSNWIMRGTLRGVSIEESTGVADRKAAEEIIAKRQAEILTESVWGKTATITFAHAVADYLEHGADNKRFLTPLLNHFHTTLLREIDQHAVMMKPASIRPFVRASHALVSLCVNITVMMPVGFRTRRRSAKIAAIFS